MFFDKDYEFKGKHAKYVIELKSAVFDRNLDVLLLAPIVGLVNNRRSEIDNSTEYLNMNTKVFAEQMTSAKEELLFHYRLCMLLTDELNKEDKKDNAFKYYHDKDEECKAIFEKNIKVFNSYILGGVEVLYEMLLKGNKEYNGKTDTEFYKRNVIENVTEFVSDYMESANQIYKLSEEIDHLV